MKELGKKNERGGAGAPDRKQEVFHPKTRGYSKERGDHVKLKGRNRQYRRLALHS